MERIKLIINKIKNNTKTELPKDVEWKEFKLNEIFENPKNGSEIIKNTEEGNINLISSCEGNNGVVKKISNGKNYLILIN